jgi:MYXO-CTERM domain-containing protein
MDRDSFTRAARALALCASVLSAAAPARADGNEAHGVTLDERGAGLSAATFGVGLSGGRENGTTPTPLTSATITVAGIPAGATIEHAYLYWVVYGDAGNSSIKLGGATLTGTAIGTSAGTCWKHLPTRKNFAYRVDVTAKVSGNGQYVLTGFPSSGANIDSQGASLFIVYTDPADDEAGRVILTDGAITAADDGGGAKSTFANLQVPSTVLSAKFMLGVGDGEPNLVDGALELDTEGVPVPPDGTHYRSSAGKYWDARTYDVKALLKPGSKTIEWEQSYASDCLVFAFSALSFRASTVDADGDDTDDALDNCPGVKNPDQAETDGDGLGDACDNCPLRKNSNQNDQDNDGTGNICDTCPQLANPDNLDSDNDGWGDACDTCATVANPSQIRPEICPDTLPGGGSGGSGNTGGIDGDGSGGEAPSTGGSETASNGGEPTSNGGDAPSSSGKGGTKSSGGSGKGATSSSEGGAGESEGNAEASDSGGCGCAIPGASGSETKLLAFAAAALAVAWRRRRIR